MELILYANHSEKNKLHKDLTEIATLSGTLRTGCSIVNPQIVIQLDPQTVQQSIIGGHVVDDNGEPVLDDNGVPVLWSFISKILSANYVRIPDFNRYYFVDNVTSVNKDLWMLTLISDGIMSFEDRIKNTVALIARNEFTFDSAVEDNRIISQYPRDVVEVEYKMINPEIAVDSQVMGKTMNSDWTEIVNIDYSYFTFTVLNYRKKLIRVDFLLGNLLNTDNSFFFTTQNHVFISKMEYEQTYYGLKYVRVPDNAYYLVVNSAGFATARYVEYVSFEMNLLESGQHVLATIIDSSGNPAPDNGIDPGNTVLTHVYPYNTEMINDSLTVGTLSGTSLKALTDYITDHQSAGSYVINMSVLPVPIPIKLTSSGIDSTPCMLGSTAVPGAELYLPEKRGNYLFRNSKFKISGTGTFLDYEPYSKYEIYVPYVSWITFDAANILNKDIELYYLINFADGSAFAFLIDVTSNKLLWGGSANMGVKIPITATNAQEISNAKMANTLNLVLGLVASGVSIAGGAVTANPIAVAGGAISAASTVGSFVTRANEMYERASCNISSGNSGAFAPQSVRVRKTSVVPQEYDSNFAHTFGKPLNKHKRIGDLTGMTVVGECHLEGFDTATSQELDSIEATLKAGIII